MGCKDIRENQGTMSRIPLKISGKIREFFSEIVVATRISYVDSYFKFLMFSFNINLRSRISGGP